MSRITATMAALAKANKKALVPYFVTGDPDIATTQQLMEAVVDSGADIIELGVPFSDPMAEGPTIQLAHERALENNISLTNTLDLVADFRKHNDDAPVVLMGYANPIEAMGYEVFAQKAQAAGVDGVLIVDLPPEESAQLREHLQAHAIDMIFLLAPTTKNARIKAIVNMASGYLYYVSLKGVTGAGHLDLASVESKVSEIRSLTDLPICVGFGIKDAQSCKNIAKLADGAVVGSALVDKIAQAGNMQQRIDTAAQFMQDLRNAMDA